MKEVSYLINLQTYQILMTVFSPIIKKYQYIKTCNQIKLFRI